MLKVTVPVGEGLNEAEILEFLQSYTSAIRELVASDLRRHGDRAEVHEVYVNGVDFSESHPGVVTIHYEFSWSAYYGCKDANTGGDEEESAEGIYKDGNLEFDVPEPRSTLDEF